MCSIIQWHQFIVEVSVIEVKVTGEKTDLIRSKEYIQIQCLLSMN